MATWLATSQSELRNGVAVSAARESAASGGCENDRLGEECSDAERTNGTTKRSNRGVESCESCDTGVPEPANKLAASADKLNIMRAVNNIILA